jgi:hypothetical protein
MSNRSKILLLLFLVILGSMFYFFFWPDIEFNIKTESLQKIHLTEISDSKTVNYVKGLSSKVDIAQGTSSTPSNHSYIIKTRKRFFGCAFIDPVPCVYSDLYYVSNTGQLIKIISDSAILYYGDKLGNVYVSRDKTMYIVKNGILWGLVDKSDTFQVTEGNYFMASDDKNTYIIAYSNQKIVLRLGF